MPSLREQFADLERKKVKDYDPEDDAYDLRPSDDEDSGNEPGLQEDFSRSHYETVGKSALRQPEQPSLDAKYGGVAVSRSALENEEDDDPFAPVNEEQEEDPFAPRHEEMSGSEEVSEGSEVDQDEDSEKDEPLGADNAKRFKDLGLQERQATTQKDINETGEDSLDEAEEDESDLSEEHSLDDSDIGMNDDDDDGASSSSSRSSAASPPPTRAGKSTRSAEREELRKAAFGSASTAALASALSAGTAADVKKGQAVKQQRQTFDRLLDARIKLQKGITAMNDLPSPLVDEEEVKTAAKQAEDAALALWSTVDSIRTAILSAREGPLSSDDRPEKKTLKRKRPLNPTRTTPLPELWEHYTLLEADAHAHRRSVIDKWHTKTQPVVDPAPRSKLLRPSHQSTTTSRLTDVLDTYLATESSKLVAQSFSPATQTYDDGPFYQSLLRDLIASRSAAILTDGPAGTSVLPAKLHVSGSKHKRVDTKASKGRKVRYTVHEKLENFMAPEDRSTWTEPARDEFFGSLLGKVGALDERERDSVEDDDTGGVDGLRVDEEDTGEVEALRLFRS
ncbi:hypothetical protein Z517_09026 [Fonsecaea pedrosoi CBS 271.37]|uniref:Protein BFR2 n=1 Tax=Fonsecaea pedrosoi CBS 271.37 TaxID=1442368 RepID=A0A0D2EQK5_9EURO|nr:uncharacterized protein Z517_09026 [Fonsecaea pedrosoi CBS 271.37]KIW76582.1 hypothetical protein Z517_09026 [Fonsecaea pedrosoi CBS 271.37]